MRHVIAASTLLVALSVAVVACSTDRAGPTSAPPLVVDCAAFEAAGPAAAPLERALSVAVGQPFQVTLCSNPSTGFAWEDPTWTGDPTLDMLERGSDAAATALPGAAGLEAFRFRTTTAGTTRIEFVYSQPWAGGSKGAWRLTLTVTVA